MQYRAATTIENVALSDMVFDTIADLQKHLDDYITEENTVMFSQLSQQKTTNI